MNQLSGVKKKDELIFIQKTLKKITGEVSSFDEIKSKINN